MKLAVAVSLLAVVASAGALASNCYRLTDRNGEVTYQGWVTPLDLSDEGKAGWEAARARGEHLVFFPAEICPEVEAARSAISATTIIPDSRLPSAGANGSGAGPDRSVTRSSDDKAAKRPRR